VRLSCLRTLATVVMNPLPPLVLAFQLTLGASPAIRPEVPDPWFGEDKFRHFFLSLAATGFTYGAARTVGLDKGPAIVLTTAAVVAAGVGKEIHDRARGDRISARDLAWDGAGLLAGLALAVHSR